MGTRSDSGSVSQPPRKKPRVQLSSEINTDQCCVCFVEYLDDVTNSSGAEWIECACGRWLHEDCAVVHALNAAGKEMSVLVVSLFLEVFLDIFMRFMNRFIGEKTYCCVVLAILYIVVCMK